MSILDKIKKTSKNLTKIITGNELVLYGDDASEEISDKKRMLRGVEQQTKQIKNSVPDMENRLKDIDKKIIQVKKEISITKNLITKNLKKDDPEMSDSYNRQILMLKDNLDYLIETKKSMSVQLIKTKMVMREAEISGRILQERIEDAEISFEVSGQVTLIGNALSSFGKIARDDKKTDLGKTLSGLQKSINEIHGGRLMSLVSGSKK